MKLYKNKSISGWSQNMQSLDTAGITSKHHYYYTAILTVHCDCTITQLQNILTSSTIKYYRYHTKHSSWVADNSKQPLFFSLMQLTHFEFQVTHFSPGEGRGENTIRSLNVSAAASFWALFLTGVKGSSPSSIGCERNQCEVSIQATVICFTNQHRKNT